MKKMFQQVRVVPEPMKGFQSLKFVDQILKHRKICGVLIGGLSELSWLSDNQKKKNKDVDVFLLGSVTESTPGQWEHGVDWWLQSADKYAPSNGTHVCLKWTLSLREGAQPKPGLYIPCPGIIQEYRQHESGLFLKENSFVTSKFDAFKQQFLGFPVLDENALCVKAVTIEVPSPHPRPVTS